MKEYDVIVLGIAVMDILATPADETLFKHDVTAIDDIVMAPGGDAVNQAMDLTRFGRRTALCCRVGDDMLGRSLVGELASKGVDTSYITVSDESVTSTSIVLISRDGQRNIVYRRGNNYDFCRADVDLEMIKKTRALSVASIYGCPKLEEDGLEQILQCARQNGVETFADMGSDKKGTKLNGIRPFLPYVDWFMPSEVESDHLTGGLGCEDAARAFLDAGAGNVVIKLGARGVYAHCRDFIGYVPSFKVKALDTTGSGDAFCAGFIQSKLEGKDTKEALSFGCACGAFNSLYLGASGALFSSKAISEFIENTKLLVEIQQS